MLPPKPTPYCTWLCRVRKRRLEGQWRRLEPGCQQLALAEGVERAPTYHDFLWAFSTFW